MNSVKKHIPLALDVFNPPRLFFQRNLKNCNSLQIKIEPEFDLYINHTCFRQQQNIITLNC